MQMGVATAGKGRVTVTDMDRIEVSNLNRQFLFRPSDVGQFKSMVSRQSASLRMFRSLLWCQFCASLLLAVGCAPSGGNERRHQSARRGAYACCFQCSLLFF